MKPMAPIVPEFMAPRRPHRLLWGVPGLLAGAALIVWGLGLRQQAEVQEVQQQVKAAREAALAPAVPVVPPAPAAYADSAREFLAEQGSGWASTLLALERTAMQGVTPIAIELQSRERSARVEVEFADYAVLMRYLDQLNAGVRMAEWSLVSAQRSGAGGAAGAGVSTAVLMRRW